MIMKESLTQRLPTSRVAAQSNQGESPEFSGLVGEEADLLHGAAAQFALGERVMNEGM